MTTHTSLRNNALPVYFDNPMPNYRRAWRAGGTYFFTLTLRHRHGNDLLIRHIESLRHAVRIVRQKYPFKIHAWVVLPDHLHAVLELPPADSAFDLRWGLIKANFTRQLPKDERGSFARVSRGERTVWQQRFWEHRIRDEIDLERHIDYAHLNPVKHGLVDHPADWPYSTFHRYVSAGIYSDDWLVESPPKPIGDD